MIISSITPHRNYVLEIRSDDGRTGFFDVSPYLESEVFSGLKEEQAFERVTNGGYFIEWECGADLSADTIEARWNLISTPASIQAGSGW
jgi:hypothetical protein